MAWNLESKPGLPHWLPQSKVTYGSDVFFYARYSCLTLHSVQLFLIFPNMFVSILFVGHAMETRMRDYTIVTQGCRQVCCRLMCVGFCLKWCFLSFQVPSHEPRFDILVNDEWSNRHMVLQKFVQAARKVSKYPY